MAYIEQFVSKRDLADQAAVAYGATGDPRHFETMFSDLDPQEPQAIAPRRPRRGLRAAVAAATLTAAVGGYAWLHGSADAGCADPVPATAHAGDTVWSLTEERHPNVVDPRPYVDQTIAENGGADIQAGATVEVC